MRDASLAARACAGALVTLGLIASGHLGIPEALITLAALVVVPLGLAAIGASIPRVLSLACGLSLAISMWLPRGPLAAALAVPWLLVTLLVAITGARRALARGRVPLEELVIDTGCVLLAIAGVWTVAARLGIHLLGFDETWCALTAAHFHYAGFALSVLAGLSGRVRALPRPIAWTLIVGPMLVALGITFSPALEVAASWALALAALGVGGLQIVEAMRVPSPARALLFVSGLALDGGMLLALAFSLANYLGFAHPTIGEMLHSHAPLNAVGFALAGMIARTIATPPSRRRDVRAVLGRTRARSHVGLGFFAAHPSATGLVDSIDRYAHAGLDPSRVDPEVRRFYERTGEFVLRVRARWVPAFVPLARVFVPIARRMGNLVLPLPEDGVCVVKSALFALPDEGERRHVRGSERAYASGAPMYVAAYAVHAHLMNIALPLPWSRLTSILRMNAHGAHGAITLSSITREESPFDEGLFLSTPLGVIAVPLSEHLTLHPRAHAPSVPDFADAGTTLVALHVFRVFGVRCLELDYAIGPA